MTRAGRTAFALLLFAAVAAAAPFAPGTRFGMVGLDYRKSGGSLFSPRIDSLLIPHEPIMSAGLVVRPNLAIGAELALFGTFPRDGSAFTNTPVFAFGPVVTYFPPLVANALQTYAVAGAGMTYAFYWDHAGWRAKLAVGAAPMTSLPVALGLEAGWYSDWARVLQWNEPRARFEAVWLSGNSAFVGVRLMGYK